MLPARALLSSIEPVDRDSRNLVWMFHWRVPQVLNF